MSSYRNSFSNLIQESDDFHLSNIAPRVEWRDMDADDHFVQFYEADDSLLKSLSGFIGGSLEAGGGAIVIATKAHREHLDLSMLRLGIDVGAASKTGNYVSLDAADTLSKFMVNGSPDPQRFSHLMGNVITRVTDGRRSLRAFGEMVALLWEEGNYSAAIRLEELWNDLQRTHSFSLFCAYPISSFEGEQFVDRLGGVCSAHTRVIPAESYADLVSRDERLRVIIQLQQKARTLEQEIKQREIVEEQLRASLSREQIARAEAQGANRMKDDFLATVSHELRTPLNAIIGWSHMLRNGRLDKATMERAFETIDRNAKSQAQLIEDILDVSRVITGKLQLKMGPVDLAAVINAAIDSVQLAAESKGIQIEVTLDSAARHTLGDSARLQQVVWNLLANALKFTPSGGRVEVRVDRIGSNVQVSVTDSGCGVSADFLPFIFDRFRQADSSTTRMHGGLGLGLSIVRHLVELHGGTVGAESAGPDAGSTFIIKLPFVGQPQVTNWGPEPASLTHSKATSEKINEMPSLEKVRVLVIDDDSEQLHTIATLLSGYRADVQTATSVTDALELMNWYKPHVLVSDLAMPGEDGYSLITKIRASQTGRTVSAVALTGYVRVEDRARALDAGFNMFVPKPVEPTELITAVAHLAKEMAETD